MPQLKSHSLLLLILLLISFSYHAQADSYLVIPSVRSISDLRSSERISKLLLSFPNNKVTAFLHSSDSQNWQEQSSNTLIYGNSDELQSALKKDSSQSNLNKLVIAQIEKENIIARISKNRYTSLICNIEDEICRYINHHINFEKKIFLIATCPKNWEDIFGQFPAIKGHFSRVMDVLKNIFKRFFPPKNQAIPLEYQYDALYLSECFPPVYNPLPNLSNIFPIGSLLGETPRREIPDSYRKPLLIANKIVLVSLGEDESANTEIMLDMMKSFPTYLFILMSNKFNMGDYALGNVIVDENVPLNEILTHSKMIMFISNGEWTPLLSSLYHGVPAITIGKSQEGSTGRQLVSHKKLGVDLSQKKLTSAILEENIRELVFNGAYRSNVKEIAGYLKGLNNNHLIPPVINRFEPAKEPAKLDL